MTAFDKNNAFTLYNSYQTILKPLKYQKKESRFKEKYKAMKAKNELLENEIDTIKNMCETYIKEEEMFKNAIAELEEQKDKLNDLYAAKIASLEAEILMLKDKNKIQRE